MTQLTNDLLRAARLAALKHNRLKQQVEGAIILRYGWWPSSVDYDDLVDGFDHGQDQRVQDCDLLMSAYGCFPKDDG